MLIDIILDRKDGVPYNPKEFIKDVKYYEKFFKFGHAISDAFEAGDEEGVKDALIDYIKKYGYDNNSLRRWIQSQNWTDGDVRESFHRFGMRRPLMQENRIGPLGKLLLESKKELTNEEMIAKIVKNTKWMDSLGGNRKDAMLNIGGQKYFKYTSLKKDEFEDVDKKVWLSKSLKKDKSMLQDCASHLGFRKNGSEWVRR